MAVTPKNNDKKIRLTKHIPLSGNTPAKTTSSTNVVSNTHVLSYTGVNLLSSASGSQPQGNTKNDKIQRATSKAKKNKLEDHHRKVVQIVLWYLDSGCSKHMTGDRSQLINYVQKFLGTVKFGNDHVAKIMGYDDYKIGNVKFLRSKDEALNFIIKFLRMIQVWLKVPVRRIRTENGTKFVNQTLRDYYEEVGISHETLVVRSAPQNGVVERRKCTLIKATRTMLIYAQALLFIRADAVATACFTQNQSIILLRHEKTPYELLNNKLPDLSFFHVFGALCYPTNDSKNLGKLQPKADIGIFIGYAPTKKAF
nr:retrovirus-related Pol polyprotein from transposon TNT 1-94 [Tanacetum cinerariifolium]